MSKKMIIAYYTISTLLTAIITMIFVVIWQALEIIFYGASKGSIVDSIMMILFIPFINYYIKSHMVLVPVDKSKTPPEGEF